MDYVKLQNLMQWRADLMTSGRIEDLGREHMFPLVLYLGDRQHVVNTLDGYIALVQRLRSAHPGMINLHAEVTAMDLPRHGRFRVWVTYREKTAVGRGLVQAKAVHFCRETAMGIRTEMSEYAQCSPPRLWSHQALRLA